jgi:isopentenyl-diphosphate delta-isomerase
MLAINEDMLIDAVDEQDRPIAVIKRSEALPQRHNFRVVHLFLFNSRRELLVQHLGRTRNRHGGYWGSSVAGYVLSGESYRAAAGRRLGEELGIFDAHLFDAGTTSMTDESSTKFIRVFTAAHDGPFRPDTNHIEAVQFLPLEAIVRMKNEGSMAFTPTFLHVLDYYLLRANPQS